MGTRRQGSPGPAGTRRGARRDPGQLPTGGAALLAKRCSGPPTPLKLKGGPEELVHLELTRKALGAGAAFLASIVAVESRDVIVKWLDGTLRGGKGSAPISQVTRQTRRPGHRQRWAATTAAAPRVAPDPSFEEATGRGRELAQRKRATRAPGARGEDQAGAIASWSDPRTAVRADDWDSNASRRAAGGGDCRRPGPRCREPPPWTTHLAGAAELHYRVRHDREDLELRRQDFYTRHAGQTTEFHRNLAQLPFRLCVNASPDGLMSTALTEAGSTPVPAATASGIPGIPPAQPPSHPEEPLVYHLFGHPDDPGSPACNTRETRLTSSSRWFGDSASSRPGAQHPRRPFDVLPLPRIRIRELVPASPPPGPQPLRAPQPGLLAFEDTQFFEHPEHEQAVGFFSGERLIYFRRLQWEPFARHLREAYGTRRAPSHPDRPRPGPMPAHRRSSSATPARIATPSRRWPTACSLGEYVSGKTPRTCARVTTGTGYWWMSSLEGSTTWWSSRRRSC